ncbi:putative nuclease HARBI1 [Exaiptasia diaphana]|nr:putative nuclease HARBI1 [Exaiptasia diaphana]
MSLRSMSLRSKSCVDYAALNGEESDGEDVFHESFSEIPRSEPDELTSLREELERAKKEQERLLKEEELEALKRELGEVRRKNEQLTAKKAVKPTKTSSPEEGGVPDLAELRSDHKIAKEVEKQLAKLGLSSSSEEDSSDGEEHSKPSSRSDRGDSGYGCSPYLMTPFSNPQTRAQESFNKALTKTRVTIEQTFGRWKRRFHILHSEMQPEKVCVIIGACAVLHNIAIMRNEPMEDGDKMAVLRWIRIVDHKGVLL